MSYSADNIAAAEKIIESRRYKAENEAAERERSFSAAEPVYTQIKTHIANTGISAARIVLSKKGNAKEQLELLKKDNLISQQAIISLLEKHGLPHDHLDTKYSCSKCRDTGYIDGKMCSCLIQTVRRLEFAQLNSLSPLSLCTFDSFNTDYYPDSSKERMRHIFDICKSFAETFPNDTKGLLFSGGTGLGKTHLSLAVANSVMQKGFGVIYGSIQNLLNKIENERFGRESSGSDSLKTILDCDLLILDDLGAEFSTQFTVSVLYQIINTRLLTETPTIISTNLSPSELEKKYGARIISRISGNYRMLGFQGNDIRLLRKSK